MSRQCSAAALCGPFVCLVSVWLLAFVSALAMADVEDSPLAGLSPEGPVVLVVTGNIGVTNAPGRLEIDMAMLEKLPASRFETETIWSEGRQSFAGVSLEAFLRAVGARGTRLHATALNDYAVDIPVTDAIPGGPIIAYSRNGAPMHRRDRGPLWIVYPYDADIEYRRETIYARSLWQLVRIDVRD